MSKKAKKCPEFYVITGNGPDDLEETGPFDSRDAAFEWAVASELHEGWWVAVLYPPEAK